MTKQAKIVLATGLACAAMTVAIHFILFPPVVYMFFREWGLHFFAVVATCLLTGFALGWLGSPSDRDLDRRLALACFVPFTFLLLHEVGQWVWPKDARDTFDSVRDTALNALGTLAAYALLRACRPQRAPSQRR